MSYSCKRKIVNINTKNINVDSLGMHFLRYSHLLPLSFFRVPPYFGLVPIKSIISGIQLANMAYTPRDKFHIIVKGL